MRQYARLPMRLPGSLLASRSGAAVCVPILFVASLFFQHSCLAQQEAIPSRLQEAPRDRLVLDDMEDITDWGNGSPDETALSASTRFVKEGAHSLLFANVVDHTKGEKNYPVGWPRTRLSLPEDGPRDFSGYDFFECWIRVETSRESLPSPALGIGFYHGGAKRSTSFELPQVKKGEWAKVMIPIASIAQAGDIEAVQFHISESEYRHGDEIDFYIDDMGLTRFTHPIIEQFRPERGLLCTNDRHLLASYSILGLRAGTEVTLSLEIGQKDTTRVKATAAPCPAQEIAATWTDALQPGRHWVKLIITDSQGEELDQLQTDLQVIEGPYQ